MYHKIQNAVYLIRDWETAINLLANFHVMINTDQPIKFLSFFSPIKKKFLMIHTNRANKFYCKLLSYYLANHTVKYLIKLALE
jgi:hypothetical protein